ncbi:MAG: carboxypeptidase-like regulatory domain-containing protein, partial [candidate division WOR-3 bacterium]
MIRVTMALLLAGTGISAPVGSIVGLVVDAGTREPLAGASVVVSGLDLGAAADASGRFVITRVPAGTWSVEASMVGYRAQVRTPVAVNPGHATEVEFRLSPEPTRLAEVVVRPDHFPKVKDAPVSERNFAAEEIRVAPGGNGDIQRVVQAMPAVVSSGDQDNEVIVRGGNPNENLFLVDGIEIPYPNHFGSFTTQGGPINMLNGLLVREVDFVAGAFPARYGGRTSSVMDISLKRGSARGFDGNIDMGMAGLGAVFGFPLPGRGNSFIGSYHKSFLEIMSASGVWGMSAVPYYDNLLAKATLRFADGQELTLLGLAGWDKIVLKAGEDVVKYSYSARYQTFRTAGGLALQSLFGKTGHGRFLLSGTGAEWKGIATRDSLWQDTIQVTSTGESSYGCRYDLSLRLADGQETQAGINASRVGSDFGFYIAPDTVFRYQYGPDSVVIDSTPLLDTLGRPYVALIDCSARAQSWKTGAYLQHRLGLIRLGTLTLGVRADWFGYTGEWTVSPRLGFSTSLLPGGIGLNLGWGVHYQEPQWYMLLQDSVANRHMRSRRSDHYVLGLERLIGDDARV